ncbi:hypothetical protein CB1_000904002 [Camelus ferus]|nr:hypothetical protein CB1_000904002 [Camelus ferus]
MGLKSGLRFRFFPGGARCSLALASPGSWAVEEEQEPQLSERQGGITQVTFPGNQFAEAIETAALEVEEKFSLQEHLCPNQRSVALPPKPSPDAPSKRPPGRMRQLKGKPKKETSKDKKERKQAMQEARQQITTVVLPTLAVVVLLIVVFVYVATRPTVTE